MALVNPKILIEEPELLPQYPHFLISTLLLGNGGLIRGEQLKDDPNRCDWYIEEPGGVQTLLGSQETWKFRNVLANFALHFGRHNPYGGASSFEVHHDGCNFHFDVTTKNQFGYRCKIECSKVNAEEAANHTP